MSEELIIKIIGDLGMSGALGLALFFLGRTFLHQHQQLHQYLMKDLSANYQQLNQTLSLLRKESRIVSTLLLSFQAQLFQHDIQSRGYTEDLHTVNPDLAQDIAKSVAFLRESHLKVEELLRQNLDA